MRTLVFAERNLSENDLKKIEQLYLKALSNLKEKNQRLNDLYEEFEKDLEIIGCTAVEDCLQDDLSKIKNLYLESTLQSFREIGIKVWMLTGDNPFTAVNIAHSCGLIDKKQKSFIVSHNSRKIIKQDFEKILNHIQKIKKHCNYANNNDNKNTLNTNQLNDFCLIITGDALTVVQKDGAKFSSINVINNAVNNSNQNKNPFGTEKNSKNNKSIRYRAAEEQKEIKEEEEEEEEAEETEHDDILMKMNNHRGNSINGSSKDYDKKNNNHVTKEIVHPQEENENEINLKKESLKSVIDLEGIEHGVLINMFVEIITSTNTVICSRVSPKQKADLILLVKKYVKEDLTTLAIGDGANDVNMITAADVGIGIMGNEGQQAARASDYVIGQFSFLKRLLFVHGREAQRKNAFAIAYILWKNFLYVVPLIM